jgi:hypothetical protein
MVFTHVKALGQGALADSGHTWLCPVWALIPLKPFPSAFTLASPHAGPYSIKALALGLYLGLTSQGALIQVKPLPSGFTLASPRAGPYSGNVLALGLYLGLTSWGPLFW